MAMKQITNLSSMGMSSTQEITDATLERMILIYPSVQKIIGDKVGRTSSSEALSLFNTGFEDPLELVDQMLSQYIGAQTSKADSMAQEIEVISNAVAEINRIWGLVMQENLPFTDPNSNDDTTPLGDGISNSYLTEIDRFIRDDLGNLEGIKVITGKNLSNSKSMEVTYGELQEMNATMTAYCDTIQVDLDTKQQEFKNVMTEISSAQEEIRDVRRAIVAITQG
ncbi:MULTISPECIES: hypothetical protein [Vibrio harveyi group]|uniref:Uncharacterized protein n=1 Tax=Vibrio harveyi TaxID=669 RepID=A0ABN4L1K2_VIBHA|nr:MULTISPECIES: hypothetical protein [Vibrio harveyi group]AMF99341.2 hypothetical protein AL538_00425 [Vibrio harveyi]EKO3870278.1 hypothetical protein [Vibrio harveyi]MDF5599663.1 hypothetical protein [Vibrio parahaemolyticus]MEA5385432.1 hypothetical protein [Vibrio parahaemolyticus]HEQ3589950.1 hypothetical protein [Vibrio harveyi]